MWKKHEFIPSYPIPEHHPLQKEAKLQRAKNDSSKMAASLFQFYSEIDRSISEICFTLLVFVSLYANGDSSNMGKRRLSCSSPQSLHVCNSRSIKHILISICIPVHNKLFLWCSPIWSSSRDIIGIQFNTSALFPFLNYYYWTIVQQILLKSADYTNRSTNKSLFFLPRVISGSNLSPQYSVLYNVQ